MITNEPRDYRLARRAYEAYMGEQPQVWFDQLNHDFQMRWVNVIRAIDDERKRLSTGRPPNGVGRVYKNSPERREEMRLKKREQLAKRKRKMSEAHLAAVRDNAVKARAALAAKHKRSQGT